MTMLDLDSADSTDPQPATCASSLNAHDVAHAIATDLRELYGERLRDVLLFGSWARRDAHPESDIDLLVVLDDVPSRRRELARMSNILWRHSLESDTVVTEIPVSEAEYRESAEPLLQRACAEGVSVA
jgi:predicted nucleotidyltransferase